MEEVGTQLGIYCYPLPQLWEVGEEEKIPESDRTGRLAEESTKLTSTQKGLEGGVLWLGKGRKRVRAGASSQAAVQPLPDIPCPHLQCLLGNEGPGLLQTQDAPFLQEHLFVLERVVIDRETNSE